MSSGAGARGWKSMPPKMPSRLSSASGRPLNFLAEYAGAQGYGFRFALEPKPNEPRGDIYLPTVGAMLGFIATLDRPALFGVNPEYAHETIAGLNFYHAVAQALEAGKLFHIDLNGQKVGRFDQDLRFGQEDYKGNFFLVKLLADYGYAGPKHFDAHPLRTSDPEDVWSFASGCMRTYLILQEKVSQFNGDGEIQSILQSLNKGDEVLDPLLSAKYSAENAARLKDMTFDVNELASQSLPYERLDQLTFELLMGVK